MRKFRIRYFVIMLSLGIFSCSLYQKHYVINEANYEPHFYGEIKENNLKGIKDTLTVELFGVVTNFDTPVKDFELVFNNISTNETSQIKTDINGKFKLLMSNGEYILNLKNSNPWFGKLEFDKLFFKSGEIRELKIYTESLGEDIVSEIVFKNKRSYKKYLKNKMEKNK